MYAYIIPVFGTLTKKKKNEFVHVQELSGTHVQVLVFFLTNTLTCHVV